MAMLEFTLSIEDCPHTRPGRFICVFGTLGGRGLGKDGMGAGSKQVLPFASFPSFGASPKKACKASFDGGTHF